MKHRNLFAAASAIAASVVMFVLGASATEYVELDYVEATGAQWVDTGLIGRCGTKAEIKVEWTDLSADVSMLACRRDSGNTRINLLNANGVKIGYGYGTYAELTYNGCVCFWEKGRIYTVVTDFAASGDGANVSLTIDGINSGDKSVETQVNAGTNLVVFGNNYNGVVGLAKARCYGLKIWQDGTLVRDFVPVSVNGRAGFRDSVSGDFFYSASGTDLIAGTLANEPDRFVDYIESSGSEYIDLGVVGKSGVKMESKMMWVEIPSDGSYVASRLGSSTRFYLMHHYGSQTIGYGAYNQTGEGATAGTVYDITTDLKAGSQTCIVNGSTIYNASNSSAIDTELNLYLFGCNKDGVAQYKSKARCYSLKLWDGETLVRDFRPCLKRGEACLYDEVSHRIFRTKSGTLKFGGLLPTSGKPDYFVTYIESKGNNYLDTGIRAVNNLRVTGDFNYTQSRSDIDETYVYLEPPSKKERTLIGACASDSGNRCYAVHVNAKALWFGYGDRKVYPEADGGNFYPGTGRHLFDVTLANGAQSVNVDGDDLALSGDVASYDIDAGCNLYLFACNKGGIAQYQSNARCYSLKIWQDNTLVRDLRPCVKDGVAGFYDYVNDEIIYTAFPVDQSCIGEMDFADEDFESVRGGRKSIDGDYEVHTFRSSGTLIVKGRGAMDILVVGGGGGGGSRNAGGGGGGGGGVIYRTSFAVTSGVYQVVVGAGGAGGSNDWGNNGGDSSIMGFVAKGGGGGGGAYISGVNTHYTGQDGGSGGGGSGAGGGTADAGIGTPEQGKNGGYGAMWSGGGGGGATEAGGFGTYQAKAGDGGAGFVCSISGSEVCYGSGGGGGAGGTAANNNNGTGGANGGDGGAYDGSDCSPGGNGVDGSGGGGGGGGGCTANSKYALGGNGGSGVVIIRCKYIPRGTTITVR